MNYFTDLVISIDVRKLKNYFSHKKYIVMLYLRYV